MPLKLALFLPIFLYKLTLCSECMVSLKAGEGIDGQLTLSHRHPEFSAHNNDSGNKPSFIEHRQLYLERKSRDRALLSTEVRTK